ncbi:MAG: hypothetical protein FWC21_00180 [Treponema sp.]|nr:hypothetical protein [Treponema sp.]
MKFSFKVFFIPLIFLCSQNLHSLDIHISEANVKTVLGGIYSRGSHFSGEISGIGSIDLNNALGFTAGFSFGRTLVDTEINVIAGVNYSPFKIFPLSFSARYYYNLFPEYRAQLNSIVPVISFNGRIFGVSLGMNFRFSSHFREPAQFESIVSFYGYLNFINNDRILVGAGAGNLRDFHANNMGAISFNVYAQIPVADNLTIINDIEYSQSGMDGLTATLFKMAFKTGVKILW